MHLLSPRPSYRRRLLLHRGPPLILQPPLCSVLKYIEINLYYEKIRKLYKEKAIERLFNRDLAMNNYD